MSHIFFFFEKKRKSISFSIIENRVITFLFVVGYRACFQPTLFNVSSSNLSHVQIFL